jgi:hypothetical protein
MSGFPVIFTTFNMSVQFLARPAGVADQMCDSVPGFAGNVLINSLINLAVNNPASEVQDLKETS